MSAQMSSMTPTAADDAPIAAPFWRMVLSQTRAELTMTLRRGESVLITLIIPILLLVFFTVLKVGGVGSNFIVPGVMALAVMSAGMVSLSIATAYERYYGVLKRLGASPLSRFGLILAKSLSVVAVEIIQMVILSLLGVLVFGWRPTGSVALFVLVFLVGTATFSGLGMLMAGALRAEATLAGANGLYLVFVLLPGAVLPISLLPNVLRPIAEALPAAALSDALYGATQAGQFHGASLLWLVVWGVVFFTAAALTFKWE